MRSVLKININNELDVVLAYKRAMQLSERVGIALANQTKFATAVSEICRNVVEHVGSGSIQFGITEDGGLIYLEAFIADRGRGIGNLEHLLARTAFNQTGRGTGLVNSRKLVDSFLVESDFEKGTRVTLRKRIPAHGPVITKKLLETWAFELDQESEISPYAEIKKQNMQLLDLLEELRLRNLEVEQQLLEIRRLNGQLQSSNQEIRALLAEREQKNNLLQQANEDLDSFAHTVSHDLRSPLQNILGLATVLESCLATNNTEEAGVAFPLLREQTNKMDRLITGILAYSLAGQHNLRKQIVDLRPLLHQVISSLNVPASFEIVLPPGLPLLYTQEIFLFQVFSNLIGNAVKYHDQPQDAKIEVHFQCLPEQLQFAVHDNGPGIGLGYQKSIFEKYETLGNNIYRTDSTGLGLPIVQRIVEQKGGTVWVESAGRGSRFCFTWPLSERVQDEA